jgi:group II intron reverse transcriptase/maturase
MLMSRIAKRVKDKRVLKLIEAWLVAGVMEKGRWQGGTGKGTPQGGSISPLLANIYLHYVLDLWFERRIVKQLRRKARLVRYADDCVILFQDMQDLEDFKILLQTRLAQFNLEVAEEKTHTTDLTPRSKGSGVRRRCMTFLGFNIYRAINRKRTGWKVVFQTESQRFTRAKASMKEALRKIRHWNLKEQAERINAILSGHFNYYGLAGNSTHLQNFYWETVCYWRRCLSRRSQMGRKNWEKMTEVLKRSPLRSPRIKIPYASMASYVRL